MRVGRALGPFGVNSGGMPVVKVVLLLEASPGAASKEDHGGKGAYHCQYCLPLERGRGLVGDVQLVAVAQCHVAHCLALSNCLRGLLRIHVHLARPPHDRLVISHRSWWTPT